MKRTDTPFHHHHRSSAVRPVPMCLPQLSALLSAAACLAIACLFAACTDTAYNDPDPGTPPAGTPIILTAGMEAMPATRSNTAQGVWTDGDVVAVEMDGVVKRYLASSSTGNVTTLRPADAENAHQWPGNGRSVKMRAWFYGKKEKDWNELPAKWYVAATQTETATGTDELAYQRSDFLYAPEQDITYNPGQGTAVGLTFYHQTARVVVRLRKAGVVNDGNINDIHIRLGNAPHGDYEMWNDGTFDASPINPAVRQYSGLRADEKGLPSYVAMKPVTGDAPDGYARCYEALVIPQDMSGKHFIHVMIPNAGGSFDGYYYIPASDEADLQGGYTYTYDIIASENGTLHVTVAPPIAGWTDNGEGDSGTAYNEVIDLNNPVTTINDDGKYLLTGNGKEVTLNITGGNPTVIVRDLRLSNGCIHIIGSTPEIRVEGTKNYIYSKDNPPIWLDGDNANVLVTGTGITGSKLSLYTTGRDYPNAAIGTKGSPNGSKENYRCGNIDLSNFTLYAETQATAGGSGIGTGGGEGNRKCGNITLTDAQLIALPGAGAATIGFGCAPSGTNMTGTTYEMGDIVLTNSTIASKIKQGGNGIYPAHIGSGAVPAENYTVGDITIDTDKSGERFFQDFTGGTKGNDEVVVGFPNRNEWHYITWIVTKHTRITWGMVLTLR